MEIKIECSHTELWPIEKLVPNPKNPNTHPSEQIKRLAEIIKYTGFRSPIVVSDRSGFVIKGHGRLLAAQSLGMTKVPVDVQKYENEAQEWSDMIADNRLAELSEIDNAMLSDLLNELPEIDFTGFTDEEIAELIDHVEPEQQETTGDDDILTEVPNRTVLGDIYELGNHRLMCGDSADFSNVEMLMDGKLCDMVLTDPPYGVAYVGKTKDALTIESDDCNESELKEMATDWFQNAFSVSRKGAYWIATVPPGPLHGVFFDIFKNLGVLRQVMVWVKDSLVIGHSEYHYKHEPILFGWVPDGERLKNSDRTKTTVWEFDRPKRSDLHPTMKPVEMWCYAINNHTKSGDLLYEPFSGSGTTHISCEKTSRICYGMEISPKYCDVIVNRYVNFCKENSREYSVVLNGNDITNEF